MSSTRYHHLDNLRTYLTILVIYHHTAISYGGSGNWGYSSPSHRQNFSPTLTAFNALNQTFFMGSFFLLSGHFSAVVARKRTRAAFLQAKFRHLGVPTVLYSVSETVLCRVIVVSLRMRTLSGLWWVIRSPIKWGIQGPVWYCAVLLIFDTVYAVLRPGDFDLTRQMKQDEENRHPIASAIIETPNQRAVFVVLGIVSVASFLVRLHYPCGQLLRLLNLSPGYLPQYVTAYVTGIMLAPLDPSALITGRTRKRLFLISVTTTILGAVFILHTSLLAKDTYNPRKGPLVAALGGWNLLAAFYALWNESSGMLAFSALASLFENYANRRWGTLARYSYAAFLVHKPTVIFWQCALDWWKANGVAKTMVVGSLGCVTSFVNGCILVAVLEKLNLRGFV